MTESFVSVSDDLWGNSIRHAIRVLGPGVGLFVDCLDSNRNQETIRSVIRSHAGISADTFASNS